MTAFNHFNFNVLDLEKSLAFYKEALGLMPVREKEASDGSFKLVYLGDGKSDFTLELTYLADRKEPYDLGECEFHLAFERSKNQNKFGQEYPKNHFSNENGGFCQITQWNPPMRWLLLWQKKQAVL